MHGFDPANPADLLTTEQVSVLLQRAAAAANVNNAIIAVVDRNGTILGVRVESGVSPQITDDVSNEVFAIDGAVALARTGAYFGNDQAPLTSRTIQMISQTTVTQREVQSNPDVPDPNGDSTLYGPGFVAPVGIKGHFPPGIMFTPQVDLFGIESTNRDTLSATVTGTRFNVPPQYIPPGGNSGRAGVVRAGDRHSPHGAAARNRRPCLVGYPFSRTEWRSAALASSFRARPDSPPKRTQGSTRRWCAQRASPISPRSPSTWRSSRSVEA